MLIVKGNEPDSGHGSPQTDFCELRRRLAVPSSLNDGHRQRLRELAQKVAQIQASGGECRRVDISEHVSDALNGEEPREAGKEPRDGRRRRSCASTAE